MKRYRGKSLGRTLERWPWWISASFGVCAFSVLRFLGYRIAIGPTGEVTPHSLDSGHMVWLLGWVALAICLGLAVRSALAARRRAAWFESFRSVSAIRRMNWQEFERLVAEAFRRKGFKVELTGQGGADGGIDLVLRRERKVTLVQCKRWQSNSVGAPVVREMFGLMAHHHADAVAIVCTGGFTREAVKFAEGKPIELLDGDELVALMRLVQQER